MENVRDSIRSEEGAVTTVSRPLIAAKGTQVMLFQHLQLLPIAVGSQTQLQ